MPSTDSGDNLVGIGFPDEGTRLLVVLLDEATDGGLQVDFRFMFTVPSEVTEIAFQNKAVVYAILFDAGAATFKTTASDPKHLVAREKR